MKMRKKLEKRVRKPKKQFVNRLKGRTLRSEFAEDPSTRYKKRYSGKGNSSNVDKSHEEGEAAVSDRKSSLRGNSKHSYRSHARKTSVAPQRASAKILGASNTKISPSSGLLKVSASLSA